MFIKLTRTDGTPVWLNPEFIVRIEPWKKGSAVAAAGDGDFEVMEDPRAILAMAGGVRVSRPATGETSVGSVEPTATGETPVVPVEPVATGETPVVPVRKTRSRKKAVAEPEPAPTAAPEPAPTVAPEPASEPPPAPAPTNDLFPQAPDEVAVAAAILKKNRCRSRKRIENTIKSMNPKMSMADARALLQQMEARGFVLIDAQGHATFT